MRISALMERTLSDSKANIVTSLFLVVIMVVSATVPLALADTQSKQAWVNGIVAQRHSPGVGCWTVSYPNTTWAAAKCGNETEVELANIGNTGLTDFLACSCITMSSTSGSVTSMSGFLSETDTIKGGNWYSIQINTNRFSTTYDGYSATGWEQFVFQNQYGFIDFGYVSIEYWLLGWLSSHTSCPSNPSQWTASGKDCEWTSSPANTGLELPQYLTAYTQSGFYSGSTDTSEFCDANAGKCWMSTGNDLLGLSSDNWGQSEWNVFGFANGSGALFNSGGGSISLTIHVSGPSITGSCSQHDDNTAEYNNLNLGSCSASGNAITFTESK